MDLSDQLALEIAQLGTRHVFGIPGSSSSLEIIDALLDRNVNFHTTYFEGSAAIMAGAIGKLSGLPGCAICIKGPGLANMVPGLAVCALEHLPLVALSESYALNAPNYKTHKRMDHIALTSAVVKNVSALSSTENNYHRCASLSSSEKPGPVLLNLAEGKEVQICETQSPMDQNSDIGLHKLLEKSFRPLVIAGSLAIRMNWSEYLNKLSIPVFTTVSAKGVVDENLECAAGIYTGSGLEKTPEYSMVTDADLIIGLGLRSEEVLSVNSFPCESVNVDLFIQDGPGEFNFRTTVCPDYVDAIFNQLSTHKWGLEKLFEQKNTLRRDLFCGEFLPAHVFEYLTRRFGNSVRLVVDTGYFGTIAEHYWTTPSSNYFLCAGNSRYMGTSLPMAIGASFYDNNVPTVVAVGDGGIGMFISELRLAVEQNLPLLVLLFSDGGFGSVRTRAIEDKLNEKPLIKTSASWLGVVDQLGVGGVRATNEVEFCDALSKYKIEIGPFYIECVFDPDDYQQMTLGLRG